MKLKKKTIKKPRVEMIPLIDSVFLILVFFIYAFISMTIHKGLPVNLPHATAALIDKADYCAITISDDDALFLNKQPIDIATLKNVLHEMYVQDKELRVYINGDKDAHHYVALFSQPKSRQRSDECNNQREHDANRHDIGQEPTSRTAILGHLAHRVR